MGPASINRTLALVGVTLVSACATSSQPPSRAEAPAGEPRPVAAPSTPGLDRSRVAARPDAVLGSTATASGEPAGLDDPDTCPPAAPADRPALRELTPREPPGDATPPR